MQNHTAYQSRLKRVRSRLRASGRPRLTVFRTNAHLWAQLIDDQTGRVIVSCSTKTLGKTAALEGTKMTRAALVGKTLATLALANKVSEVVFDRGAYKYHGRVKALADAARQEGLKF